LSQGALWPAQDRTTGLGSVDRLERYYTPDPLAALCLSLLPWDGVRSVLEPHAGGGAFVRDLKRRGVFWTAYDTDPTSRVIVEHDATLIDFLTVQVGTFDRVVGNPPFSNAEEHVERALSLSPECAFLMPLDRLESRRRLAFWQTFPARRVTVFSERVWPGSRSIAWFWWDSRHNGPTELRCGPPSATDNFMSKHTIGGVDLRTFGAYLPPSGTYPDGQLMTEGLLLVKAENIEPLRLLLDGSDIVDIYAESQSLTLRGFGLLRGCFVIPMCDGETVAVFVVEGAYVPSLLNGLAQASQMALMTATATGSRLIFPH